MFVPQATIWSIGVGKSHVHGCAATDVRSMLGTLAGFTGLKHAVNDIMSAITACTVPVGDHGEASTAETTNLDVDCVVG